MSARPLWIALNPRWPSPPPHWRNSWAMSDRPQKITFADLRDMGVRGLLIYCSEFPLQPLDRDQRRPLVR
jgi:hypothetical protein